MKTRLPVALLAFVITACMLKACAPDPALGQTAGPGLYGDAHWRAPAETLPTTGNRQGDVRLSAAALWYWNGIGWTQLGGSRGGGGGGAPTGAAGGELAGTYPDPLLKLAGGAPDSAPTSCAIGRAYLDTTDQAERVCFCVDVDTWRCQTLSRQLFEPNMVSGMTLWLRGESLMTLGYDDGQQVQHWPDSSGTGNGANQVAASQAPLFVPRGLNGYPVVRFDGVLQSLVGVTNSRLISAPAATVFAVYSLDAIQTNFPSGSMFQNEAIWSDQQGYIGLHLSSTPPTISAYNFAGAVQTVSHTISLGAWQLAIMRHGSGQLCLTVDAQPEACTASGNTDLISDQAQIGQGSSSARITGQIGMLLIYNRSLNPTEIARVSAYLRARFGL